MEFEPVDDDLCRAAQVHLELLGRKWNSGILLAAMRGARRFGEYRRTVTGISDRMLAVRLRELEVEGLLERVVIPTTPVQVRYEPTELGASLLRALQPLIRWGVDHEVGVVHEASA